MKLSESIHLKYSFFIIVLGCNTLPAKWTIWSTIATRFGSPGRGSAIPFLIKQKVDSGHGLPLSFTEGGNRGMIQPISHSQILQHLLQCPFL